MTIANAKWELEILLNHKKELLLQARQTDYNDDNRVKELRKFLDEQTEATPGETPSTRPDPLPSSSEGINF